MIDPMTSRVAQVLHQERLAAASRAREQASWGAGQHLFGRLITAIRAFTHRRDMRQPGNVVKHVYSSTE